jgi:hypothetical protein
MENKNIVLCGSNAYEKKYYFNNAFKNLPGDIKDELKILCVTFTEEVGGIIVLKFNKEGNLTITTQYAEEDILYDEIGCGLKIREIQNEKRGLMEKLEMYYKVLILKKYDIN